MAHHVQCEVFDGPLDLLVSLAHRGQIDLSRVPLGSLAEAYRQEQSRGGPNLDEATDALVHFAVLADLKARTLVPSPPPAEAPPAAEEPAGDLRDRLGAQMAEYLQFREAAQALRHLEHIQSNIFGHPAAAADLGDEVLLDGVTLEDLFTAFTQVLHRAENAPTEIAGEEFTVEQKMTAVVQALDVAGGTVLFGTLFRTGASRLEIIVTFLALLELIKSRRIRARQSKAFDEIEIVLVDAR
ncbi:MAG TPA: segregation/condensation protein A [bacterium]|nr:segregation/condensation protein A [bacterium]